MIEDRAPHFAGVLLGTAVGDAIGLPREGLSRRRAMRIFGGAPLRHAFILGRGMTSDDTEHACMTAQALLASRGDPDRFASSLAWRLRWWILGLPAGVGLATARAVMKLWLGFGADRSGVWSAGNGPTMRAAIIGAYVHDDLDLLETLVKRSTRLTHTDPAAEHGALAVALAAACGFVSVPGELDFDSYMTLARMRLTDTPMLELLETVSVQVREGRSFEQCLESQGLGDGISGYINHTVPAAIFCWMKWPGDFRTAVEQIVIAGGDSDTTGAIVGALIGATAGEDSIPNGWIDGLLEWPRSVAWMRRLARECATSVESKRSTGKPISLFWPEVLIRNVVFLCIVLLHGLRRILPPY